MIERRKGSPNIRFKVTPDRKKTMVVTGRILPVPESGGRKVVFQVEGATVSWVWVVSYTTTWLVKHGYQRSAERGEDNLAVNSMDLVRLWLKRGLTGDKEIVVHEGAREGVPRVLSKNRKNDLAGGA